MSEFVHQRHKPSTPLARPRELILACPALKSNVNFSRIVRVASCCGVTRLVTSGTGKVDSSITRDGVDAVEVSVHRTLLPVLQKLQKQGFELVGLEQTTHSESLTDISFQRNMVLVIGHERHGINDDILAILGRTVEIPVFGLPFSYNVATATAMALYEYCRQFPTG